MESRWKSVDEVLDAMQGGEFAGDAPPGVNDIGVFGSRPLKVAVSWGDLTAIDLLIEAGASIDEQNENGNTALHHALVMSHFHVARRLVALGADQTTRNNEGKLARDLCWSEEWPGIGLKAP